MHDNNPQIRMLSNEVSYQLLSLQKLFILNLFAIACTIDRNPGYFKNFQKFYNKNPFAFSVMQRNKMVLIYVNKNLRIEFKEDVRFQLIRT